MTSLAGYRVLAGSEHPHPAEHRLLQATNPAAEVAVTLQLRRGRGTRGADPAEMEAVAAFARSSGMEVRSTDAARRSVIVSGPAVAMDKAFDVQLNDYESEQGRYRSHDGAVSLPPEVADYVEAVVGLTDRKVLATHFSTAAAARRRHSNDPPNTVPLTPAQVAALYNFPAGDGSGQTIGLYEMETGEGPAGYAASDIAATMAALGHLPMPKIVDVPVDGTQNSGRSDGETGLDITVAGAIAPKATIAVYFAGGQTQNMLHALQMMIHPAAGEPAPGVISISYGWGPDDKGAQSLSDAEFAQFTALFEDAASKHITVFVSSGDSGAKQQSSSQAQASYPASDVWVTACGGTAIGNISDGAFDEWVWNDGAGRGATGGGVSARFPVPTYQAGVAIPKRNGTGQAGRGVPDIAGNASENSGYLQVINGSPPSPVGGTSAVAPLYAGLVARINQNNGFPAGFLNPTLYSLPSSAFRDIVGAPGPANNSYGGVKGYPAGPGWDACTGRGSVDGTALQSALAAAAAVAPAPAPAPVLVNAS